MAEQSGIDLMRRRIERASRQAPPSRRGVAGEASALLVDGNAETPAVLVAAAAPPQATKAPTPASPRRQVSRPSSAASRRPHADPERLRADLPPVNLAIRVRKPLDDRLAEVIHQLRGDGVRSSKVELIEMLLWEMPPDDLPALRERLRQFRDWAPRGTSAPLGPGGS